MNLYSQVIISSGHAIMTTRTLAHQQVVYEKFVSHLSIDQDLTPRQRLEKLRSVSVTDLLEAYKCTGSPIPNWQATVDGFLVKSLPKASDLQRVQYNQSIRRIIIGDCDEEVRCSPLITD